MDVKKEFIKTLAGITLVLTIAGTVRYFQLAMWQVFIFIALIQAGFLLWKKSFTWWRLCKSLLNVALILTMFHFLSYLGGWGYILGCVIIALKILYQRRAKYFQVKEHIEGMIWGRPLKEFVSEGKKPPKLKFVLKK